MRPHAAMCLLAVAATVAVAAGACAQDYPHKPVRIVTAGVGGGSDFISRVIAQAISGPLGQQVIVDNRPSGYIPGDVVSKAPPDGYTLLVASNGFWLDGFLRGAAPYDPVRDFIPITTLGISPSFLVVHPALPVKSVKGLIALAKARPGELNYASGAVGGADHLAAELFKAMAGIDMVRIGYKSGATRTADLIGGHVQLSFGTGGTVAPHIKSGKLRALAVTSVQRSLAFPDLPTVASAGVPGYEAVQTVGIFAPAQTPLPIVNRLNQEIVRAAHLPEVKSRLLNSGVESVSRSREQFAALIKADRAKWGRLIRAAGIRVE